MSLSAVKVPRASALRKAGVLACLAAAWAGAAMAEVSKPGQPLTINWYHGAVYLRPVMAAFTAETGVAVDVSSAYDEFNTDVILVSDYKNLTEAKKLGKFQTLDSRAVEQAVPARWRDRDGYWTGVVLRARAPIYNKSAVGAREVPNDWFDLADPKWRGKLTLRGGNNVYNRSLLAWMIHHHGAVKTERWAQAVVANRKAGAEWRGDTGNAEAIARAEFALGFINTYYLGYLRTGDSAWTTHPGLVDKLGIAWMDGGGKGRIGQHVNVTGAAISSSTERDADARRLVEWLVSPAGQRLLTEHVFKYPVRADVQPSSYLQSMGTFRPDTTDLNDLEFLYDRVDRMMRKVGWTQNW